jgi:phosphatidylinositol alpha-1,6-mannosyltransferase
LERIARECQVNEQTRFLGKVPVQDLPDLYRAADLFALPSTGEGFGIVFLEAMASGTPAIGLAIGGATDALFHADYGIAALPDEFERRLSTIVDRARLMTTEDRQELSDQTQHRFGHSAFARRLAALLTMQLNEANKVPERCL